MIKHRHLEREQGANVPTKLKTNQVYWTARCAKKNAAETSALNTSSTKSHTIRLQNQAKWAIDLAANWICRNAHKSIGAHFGLSHPVGLHCSLIGAFFCDCCETFGVSVISHVQCAPIHVFNVWANFRSQTSFNLTLLCSGGCRFTLPSQIWHSNWFAVLFIRVVLDGAPFFRLVGAFYTVFCCLFGADVVIMQLIESRCSDTECAQ